MAKNQNKKIKEKKEVGEKGADIVEMLSPIVNSLKKVDKSYWIMGIVILIVAGSIIGGLIYAKHLNNFVYGGIAFERVPYGQLIFYTAKVPVLDSRGHISSYTSLDFRSNPRDLKDIPVSTQGEITFVPNKVVYISYDKDINQCADNTIAATNLGRLLNLLSLAKQPAVNDIDYKNNTIIPFVNCSTKPDNTVLFVRSGDKTEIVQTDKNCYEIISKDCDILKSTEKFQLQILEEYLNKFVKSN